MGAVASPARSRLVRLIEQQQQRREQLAPIAWWSLAIHRRSILEGESLDGLPKRDLCVVDLHQLTRTRPKS